MLAYGGYKKKIPRNKWKGMTGENEHYFHMFGAMEGDDLKK